MATSKKISGKGIIKIGDLSSRKAKSPPKKKPRKPVFWLGIAGPDRIALVPIRIDPKKQTFRLGVSSGGSPTPSPTPTKPQVLGGSGKKKQTITDEGDINDDTPPPTPK